MIANIIAGVLMGAIFLLFFFIYPSPKRSLVSMWRRRCRHIDGWREWDDPDRYHHEECVICHKHRTSVK